MPELAEAKVRAIQLLRAKGFSQNKTCDILGVDRETIRNREDENAKEWDRDLDQTPENVVDTLVPDVNPATVVTEEWLPEGFHDESGEEYTNVGSTGGVVSDDRVQELALRDDYEDVSPGEFIELFFDEFEVGAKTKFVRLQSRRAERRGEIPDEEKMRSDLLEMSSGISNNQEAHYIAEEYWAEAQRYLSEASASVFRAGDGDGRTASGGGNFVSASEFGGQPQGQWVQFPNGQMRYGTWTEGMDGQRVFQPMNPPGQQGQQGFGQPQPRQTQSDEKIQALQRELRQMRREMNDSGGTDGMIEAVQQLNEVQNALDGLKGQQGGGGGGGEAMHAITNEIRALRSELQNNEGPAQATNPREAVINRIVSSGDVDPGTAMELLNSMEGSSDPEVRKAEIQRDLEKAKLENKSERTEAIMSSVEGLAEKFGMGLGSAIREEGEQRQQDQQNQQGQASGPSFGGGYQQEEYAGGEQETFGTPTPETDGGTSVEVRSPGEQQGGADDRWTCPMCGGETPQNPALPGRECGVCDYSIVPCPDCRKPVELPPEEDLDRGGCPGCGMAVDLPEDLSENTACLNCEWAGEAGEAAGEAIECEGCGAEHRLQPSDMPRRA